ncbi:MAG: bifunctional glutamate N-acetyltransferase/amino-acid acetyltransferase ArgJ [Pseudomonadota bacterium]|nr:bifunctional glutamate N-acetyltransferase/amino-acid acetyltransferase ArgJ [Pseudomonadota bacterium]
MPPIDGLRLGAVAAGVKYRGRTDLMLAELAPGTVMAGVLTLSKTASAPVLRCRRQLGQGEARGVIVNSGNANAFTGKVGEEHVEIMAGSAARALGCMAEEVYVASTGVIGEKMPANRIEASMDSLAASLSGNGWQVAAEAIVTTDTFPKGACTEVEMNGIAVRIGGIAKGSGMIAPDMATMLAFVFTDAALPHALLQQALVEISLKTFNSITVDGDTSTSDTLLLAATGQAGNRPPQTMEEEAMQAFRDGLEEVLTDLATQVVRDGEGATKFITIDVSGAESDEAARRVGLAIGNSPLVKTAIAGEDANWGRVVMAVGKAGEMADRDRLRIAMGGVVIAEKGEQAADYDESRVTAHLKQPEVNIHVDLGVGEGSARVWSCDLTHGYITINADYRS